MKSACVILVIVALLGLIPNSDGQGSSGSNQRRPTGPTRRPAISFPGQMTARPSTTSPQPTANPEVPVVFRVSCDCPFPPQYNPVCGSDGQTYGNRQILNCARVCGTNVNFVVGGSCGQNRG